MRTTQYQTWRRSSTTYMGPQTSTKLTSQMPTIYLNLTMRQKKLHNQHISGTVQDVPTASGIEKFFVNLPELHRINTQSNQRCCDLSRQCLVYGTTNKQLIKKCLQSGVDYVRNILLLMRKSLTQNQLIALVFWETPFQRRE